MLAQEVHGFADPATGRKVDEHTIYHWASITKTFTGFGDVSEITIWHLRSHSAGFRNPTWPWGGDERWHPHEPTEWSQLVAMMPYTEVRFKPGSKYSYSNPGMTAKRRRTASTSTPASRSRSFFYTHPESKTGVIAAFNTAPAEGPGGTPAPPPKPNIGLIFSGLLERLGGGVFPLYVR